jgi:hypothetical protein
MIGDWVSGRSDELDSPPLVFNNLEIEWLDPAQRAAPIIQVPCDTPLLVFNNS